MSTSARPCRCGRPGGGGAVSGRKRPGPARGGVRGRPGLGAGHGPGHAAHPARGDLPSVAWSRAILIRSGSLRRATSPASGSGTPKRDRGVLAGRPGVPAPPGRRSRCPRGALLPGRPGRPRGRPTVALVGTRSPTRYGIGVAAQFGADLAAAGSAWSPVWPSGSTARPTREPRRRCAADRRRGRRTRRPLSTASRPALGPGGGAGAHVSESPAGVRTEKWRFPVRNRLLAMLSDVVVVVESRPGAARCTRSAAVAGASRSARCPAPSAADVGGHERLLADGSFPVCAAGDILMALALKGAAGSICCRGPGAAVSVRRRRRR